MYLQKSIFAFYLCLLVFGQSVRAQEIWPGDVNNNGIVNAVDLLYWGVAFGSTGPSRPEVNTDWQGLPLAETWAQSFVDGTNYAYADCDGSGIVDEDDFDDAIEDNYGLAHGPRLPDGYVSGQAGMAPKLRLTPDATLVNFGATVNIGLSLDDTDMPLENFYGLAASVSYTTDVLAGDDGADFDFREGNWIEADNSYVQDFFGEPGEPGVAELAITRTNQQTIPAMPGEIGNFSIVIEDIIVGRNVDTFRLTIDSVLVFDKDMGTIPIVPDTVTIIISNDTSTVTAVPRKLDTVDINVFPNPVRTNFFLELGGTSTDAELLLVDQLGRTYPITSRLLRSGIYVLERPGVAPGIYWLAVRTATGWSGKKIILL